MDASRLVEVLPERIGSVSAPHFPHNLPSGSGSTSPFSLSSFASSLRLHCTRLSASRLEFDLVGVDASIANALRRVLMAEVPTVAVEGMYVWNNTSIVQDEVLAHRIGLVPLRIDPEEVQMKLPGDDATDQNTVVFKLRAKCERIPGTKKEDPEHVAMRNANVYSSHLTWDAKGEQAANWKGAKPRPVLEDILLAKLRPGQEIHLELHCEKGIGKDHAKFSPVATASYRLLPHIDILAPIPVEHMRKFIGCFPEGVVGVRKNRSTGEEEVYIKDARRDTVSREVLRHKEFEEKVRLGRVRDHFLFDIESTGIYAPEELLPAALKVLAHKLKVVRLGVEALVEYHGAAP